MSFSDFYPSELSDITSSDGDDDFVPKRSTANKTKRDQQPYTIPNPLRPPRSTSYSVRALYEQIVDGSIDLDPDYQRDVVWSEQKQIGLIDSVFRNYYIPPIIFAVSTSDDGSESRVCIDGKQRLTSIQKFLDGLIPHRDHITAKRYWCKKCGTTPRVILPTPLLQAFANKQIVCVEYDSLSEEQEREIFQRVQLGVALTPAERMQAITGPWPNFIREIQSQVLGDDGFGNSFDWGRGRGRDFHGLASIVYLIEQLPSQRIPPTAQTMEKWLTRTKQVPPKLRTAVLDTFRVYQSLAREKAYKKAFARRVSPIEFVMIGVMIFLKREMLSLTQLSNAVETMRTDVRSVEKDVRSNGRVSKLLFRFILEKLPRLVLRSDGKGDKSAQSTLSPLPRAPASTHPSTSTPQASATTTPTEPTPNPKSTRSPARKKRKHQGKGNNSDGDSSTDSEEGNDDDEYVPSWRRSSGRPLAKVARLRATTVRHPGVPEPASMSASAPAHSNSFQLKSENDKPITPTPSLTPHESSIRSQSEAHAAAPPPQISTTQIKVEKTESSTAPGPPPRTPMDRLAAMRAASARSSASSASVSTPLAATAPATDVPPEQSVPGSAMSPIDLESLDKLQQLLTFSAGLKAKSNASPLQATQSPTLTSPRLPGATVEDQASNISAAVLTLQKLGAFLSLPQQQSLQQQQQQQQQQLQLQHADQQTQDPPIAIPIPQTVKEEPQSPPRRQLAIKTQPLSPNLSHHFPRGKRGARGARGATGMRRHLSYPHGHHSLSRDYDRYGNGPRRGHEFERGRGRGGYYQHHRRRSSRSRSPPSRSRSRSRSLSTSRSRSRSHSRSLHRLPSRSRSRSRSWERLGEWDYEFHSAAGSTSSRGGRGGDWRAARLNSVGIGPIGPIGPGVPTAPGGNHLYHPGGSNTIPGFGRGLGGGSPAPPPVGHAPRKFDFTRERARREREYHMYREQKTSTGGPIGGDGGGGPVS